MEVEKILSSDLGNSMAAVLDSKSFGSNKPVDLTKARKFEVGRDMYVEAQARSLTLTELLEQPEYDPSPAGSPLDAFERQLAMRGLRTSGRNPITVEMFYRGAPALMPEYFSGVPTAALRLTLSFMGAAFFGQLK